jgi:A/G-specific adenine glycosylase
MPRAPQRNVKPIVAGNAHSSAPYGDAAPAAINLPTADFRRRLASWYREHARPLPWRGVQDPYATWLSEIMLQQTRVATVIERYQEFLYAFPTIADLAAAHENQVLALWSGLGYYRRARMLHRGAQFVVRELGGILPSTSAGLRTLPGVGEYTAAAIASIAFGESIAVLDGNVERVLLRILGEAEDNSARARKRLLDLAQKLVPAAARPGKAAPQLVSHSGQKPGARPKAIGNPPGDHNQAMMELGATICLPRSPLCLQCPVVTLCATRGEHVTAEREKMQSRVVAYLLALRKRGIVTEVLLQKRSAAASLMPGMLELPPLPVDATEGLEPVLRLRHAITNTNFYVRIFTERGIPAAEATRPTAALARKGRPPAARTLRKQVPAAPADLEWVETTKLALKPLTGLTRKVLQRLDVMAVPQVKIR